MSTFERAQFQEAAVQHIVGRLRDKDGSRRMLLAAATALDTAVIVGLLIVTLQGPTVVWPFFALAFGTGIASALGAPAGRAMTPSLVPLELLSPAIAVRSIASEVAAIVGPALGGFLFFVRPGLEVMLTLPLPASA